MRRPVKITLLTLGAIVALPVLLLTTTTVVNAVATNAERSQISDYGRRVPVDGKRMNVVVAGTDAAGSDTIVLLPGLGTAAPGLDFQPLIAALAPTHRVVAVEPFGTGLSDQTTVPRTAATIAREVHAALQQLGIHRYVLMGHSIAGVYALAYSAAYADELVAFVGIDSSVPGQPGWDDPSAADGLAVLGGLGLVRALGALAPDPYEGLGYSAETRRQLRLLTAQNGTGPTILDEMSRVRDNFAAVAGTTFPASLPVLLFVVADDPEVPGWRQLHERQAATVERGEVIALAGEHYLHHTQSAAIARDTTAFLRSLPAD